MVVSCLTCPRMLIGPFFGCDAMVAHFTSLALVSNNHEGTEETTRDVVEGYDGVGSGLGQDYATCLSGAV